MADLIGTALIRILPDMSKFGPGLAGSLGAATKNAGGLSGALAGVTNKMNGIASKAGAVSNSMRGSTLAIGALGYGAFKMATDFDTAMKQVQSVTRASGDELKELESIARGLGEEGLFTATEAAEGMGELARAGFDAGQITKALPQVLKLAAAGAIEVADAAKVAAVSMSTYGMAASEVGRINDVLAATDNASVTNLRELSEALVYSAPVAATSRIQFEELNGALGLMATAGFSGSLGGTALRGAIARLEGPTSRAQEVLDKLGVTVKDDTGRLKPLVDIVDQFGEAGLNTADAITLFGQRSGPAFLGLINQGAPALEKITKANRRAGKEVENLTKGMGLNEIQAKRLSIAFDNSFTPISELGGSIDETTAIMGLLVKQGYNSADAADTMTKALAATKSEGFAKLVDGAIDAKGNLVDSEGQLMSLTESMAVLESKGLTSEEALKSLGGSAADLSAIAKLGTEDISKWAESNAKAGNASEIADIQMSGMKGALQRLKGAFESVAISIMGTGLLDGIADMARGLADMLVGVNDLNPNILKWGALTLALIASVAPLASLVGFFAKQIGLLSRFLGFLVANPVVAFIAALVAAFVAMYQNSEALRESVGKFLDVIGAMARHIKDNIQNALVFGDSVSSLGDIFGTLGDKLAPVVDMLTVGLINAYGPISEVFGSMNEWAANATTQLGNLWDVFRSGEDVAQGTAEILDNIFGNTGKYVAPIKAVMDGILDIYNLIKEGEFSEAFSRFLTLGSDIIDAVLEGIGNQAPKIWDWFANFTSVAFRYLGDGTAELRDWATGISDGILEAVGDMPVIGPLVETISTMLDGVLAALEGSFDFLEGLFSWDTAKMAEGAKKIWDGLVDALFNGIPQAMVAWSQVLDDWLNGGLEALGDMVKDIPIIGGIINAIIAEFQSRLSFRAGFINILAGVFSWDMDMVTDGLTTIYEGVVEWFASFPQAVGDAVGDSFALIGELVPAALDFLGEAIPDAMKSFTENLPGWIATALTGLGKGIVGAILLTLKVVIFDVIPGIVDFLWEAVPEMLKATVKIFLAIGDFLIDVIPAIIAFIPQLIGNLVSSMITGFAGFAADLGGIIWDALQVAFDWVVENAPGILRAIGDWFASLPGIIGGFLGDLGSSIWEWVKGAFDGAADGGGDAAGGLLDWFKDLPGKVIDAIGDLGPKIGEWIVKGFDFMYNGAGGEVIRDLLEWFKGLPGLIFKGITTLGPKILGWVVEGFLFVTTNLMNGLASFFVFMATLPIKIIAGMVNFGASLVGWVTDAFNWLVTNIPLAFAAVLDWFVTLPGRIIDSIKAMADFGAMIWEWIKGAFDTVMATIGEAVASVINWFVLLPGNIMYAIELAMDFGGRIWQWIKGAFDFVMTVIGGAITGIIEWFKSIPQKFMDGIKMLADFGQMVYDWLKGAFGSAVDRGGEIVAGVMDWLGKLPGRMAESIGNIAQVIFDWMKNGMDVVGRRGGEILSGIKSFFVDLPGKIAGWISSGLSAGSEAVSNIASKIWNSIKGFVNEKLLIPLGDFKVSILGNDIKPFKGIADALKLAKGGIFDGATNAIIGEAGAEVVIPLTDPTRARELVEQSGLMGVLAQTSEVTAPAAAGLTAAAAPPSIPMGVGVAESETSNTDSYFTNFTPEVIKSLIGFGDTVWKAIAPSFTLLQTNILAVFQAVGTFLTAWPLNTWTLMLPGVLTFAQNLLFAVDGMSLNTTSSFTTMATTVSGIFMAMASDATSQFSNMSTTVSGEFRSMLSTLTADSTTGGAGVVAALKKALDAGTTAVATVVGGYAKKLAESLNPVLKAVGAKEINVSEFASGGINDPRIVSDGAYDVHVFGEAGTHGEAYIPFNPSNRKRSRQIANETVARLGGQATWFANGGVTGDTQGLNPEFMRRLQLWSASLGQTYNVGSGYRSIAEQVVLYNKYLAGTGNLAAPPGSSNHNFGLASDGPHWGGRNPGAFGLAFPVRGEPWHVEPIGAKGMRGPMPDGGWPGSAAIMPLAQPPDVGLTGLVADKAEIVMKKIYDTALAWSGSQTGSMTGPSLAPIGLGGTNSARELGMKMNAARGWGSQWNALDTLWQRESGWNPNAQNPTSTAYGIAQFLNSTWASTGIAKTSDPGLQIEAGMRYIASRYGNPQGALDFWNSHNWYANGAIFDRPTIAGVGEDGTEVLLPMSRPSRALQLAMKSGMMNVLDEERARSNTAQSSSVGETTSYDGGVLGGGPGNTYNIYGVNMDQVMAEIRARDEASNNVRR